MGTVGCRTNQRVSGVRRLLPWDYYAMRRIRGHPAAYLLPSAVTLSALACGVSAIRAGTADRRWYSGSLAVAHVLYCSCAAAKYSTAFTGQYAYSVLYLLLAALFDGLDGHVARLLHGTVPPCPAASRSPAQSHTPPPRLRTLLRARLQP